MSDPAALTLEERAQIRDHMGFMNVSSVLTYQLGVPAAVEQSFLIEGAMNKILPEALATVRQHLEVLNTIRCAMVENLDLLSVNRVGDIEVNRKLMTEYQTQYDWWRQSLGNLLGVIPNPFDKRAFGRSLNAKVHS